MDQKQSNSQLQKIYPLQNDLSQDYNDQYQRNDRFEINAQLKKVIVIGLTGSGKSSLLNTLCGKKDEFTISSSNESETNEVTSKLLNWRQSHEKFILIDTPGLADSKGQDSANIVKMVQFLKQEKFVNAFVIVLNGQNTRFDSNLQSMLKLFRDIFGEIFFNNAVIVFTHWEQSNRAKKERISKNISEEIKSFQANSKLREIGFQLQNDLKCFFVDNQINMMSEEDIIDNRAENEYELFKKEVKNIQDYVHNLDKFICKDIKERMIETDKLRKENQEIQYQKMLLEQQKNKEIKEQQENFAQQKQLKQQETEIQLLILRQKEAEIQELKLRMQQQQEAENKLRMHYQEQQQLEQQNKSLKQQVIELFRRNPNLSNTQAQKFESNIVNIDQWNGKFVKIEFDSRLYTFGEITNVRNVEKPNFSQMGRYQGMLDKKSGLPSGFGRLFSQGGRHFDDGQFKDNDWHGFVRVFNKQGVILNQEMYNDMQFHRIF